MFSVLGIKRLTSVENLSHHLQQRCSVSGTAKGKGKIKAAQTLKSKSGGKKNAPSSGGHRKSGLIYELEEIANKCLNASTPIRVLKPKERAREAEREKLGLISKERQREMAFLKKQAKIGTKSEKPSIPGSLDYIELGLVDADKIPKYELTVEDGRRLAKEYSRVLMSKHCNRQKAEVTLRRLKEEAIEALPEHLKAAALIPDRTPFPANCYVATLTPPIEGYMEKLKEAAQTSVGVAKLR